MSRVGGSGPLSRLGAWLFVRVQKSLERKTPEAADRTGARWGKFGYLLSKKHRLLAAENLARAFPEKSAEEVRTLAKATFVHFGRTMCDFMRAPSRSNEEVLGSFEVEGIEHLEAARAAGKGAILVTAHFGNWERMAHFVAARGYPVSVIARDVSDPAMNEVVAGIRKSSGVGVISRGNAAMPTLKALKRNEVVGIVPDQNSDEIFVPFFGVPCGTVTGPAVLALRGKAPILPMYAAWIGPGRYRFWVEPPLEPEPGFEPVEGLTRAVNLSLEGAIRQYPEQYLWIHNRWKSAKRRGLVT